jgi:hypothetical protein
VQELHGRDLGARGRYKLRALVARGGFGAVYRAWDSSLQREVALKVMIPTLSHEPAFVERFRREAVAVARLRHPHILEVYDFGEEPDGLLFLVMPLIEGGTLKERFTKGGRPVWRPQDVHALAAQLLPALDFAHQHGIVHRDVKPANVLLDGDWAWLADFGIARLAMGDDRGGVTLTGASAIGTPEYMAPEQVAPMHERPLDGRADLYAFGVILYELLTGRVPFRGETTWETCYQVMQAPLPSPRSLNAQLSEAVEAVLVRALARDREARFDSGADLDAALGAAIAHGDSPQLKPERTIVSGATVVAGGLAGGLAAWALWSFLAWAIGTGVFHGVGTVGQMLRAAGLAQTPSVLGFLAAIPPGRGAVLPGHRRVVAPDRACVGATEPWHWHGSVPWRRHSGGRAQLAGPVRGQPWGRQPVRWLNQRTSYHPRACQPDESPRSTDPASPCASTSTRSTSPSQAPSSSR